jgi:hypothetical protein
MWKDFLWPAVLGLGPVVLVLVYALLFGIVILLARSLTRLVDDAGRARRVAPPSTLHLLRSAGPAAPAMEPPQRRTDRGRGARALAGRR